MVQYLHVRILKLSLTAGDGHDFLFMFLDGPIMIPIWKSPWKVQEFMFSSDTSVKVHVFKAI